MKKSSKKSTKKSATVRKAREGRVEKNGVVRPYGGTTLKLWEIADKLSTPKSPADRASVLAAAAKSKIAPGTASTQYGQWRKFNGITGRIASSKPARVVKSKTPKAPKAPKAPRAPKAPVVAPVVA